MFLRLCCSSNRLSRLNLRSELSRRSPNISLSLAERASSPDLLSELTRLSPSLCLMLIVTLLPLKDRCGHIKGRKYSVGLNKPLLTKLNLSADWRRGRDAEKGQGRLSELGSAAAAKAAFEAAEHTNGDPVCGRGWACVTLGDNIGPAVFVAARPNSVNWRARKRGVATFSDAERYVRALGGAYSAELRRVALPKRRQSRRLVRCAPEFRQSAGRAEAPPMRDPMWLASGQAFPNRIRRARPFASRARIGMVKPNAR
jgi:hypothetical protein